MSETILWKSGSPGSFNEHQVAAARADGWKERVDEHDQQGVGIVRTSEVTEQSGQSGVKRSGQDERGEQPDDKPDSEPVSGPVGDQEPVRDEPKPEPAKPRGQRR